MMMRLILTTLLAVFLCSYSSAQHIETSFNESGTGRFGFFITGESNETKKILLEKIFSFGEKHYAFYSEYSKQDELLLVYVQDMSNEGLFIGDLRFFCRFDRKGRPGNTTLK